VPSKIKNYTLVFLFNEDLSKVVLIKKTRPKWQKNKFNGVGGKIENGEKTVEAAAREIKEETGYVINNKSKLIKIASMESNEWKVHIFAAQIYEDVKMHEATEEGEVQWHQTSNLPTNCIDNLPWLIPLCQNKLKENYIDRCHIFYKNDTEHQ